MVGIGNENDKARVEDKSQRKNPLGMKQFVEEAVNESRSNDPTNSHDSANISNHGVREVKLLNNKGRNKKENDIPRKEVEEVDRVEVFNCRSAERHLDVVNPFYKIEFGFAQHFNRFRKPKQNEKDIEEGQEPTNEHGKRGVKEWVHVRIGEFSPDKWT